MIRARKSIDNCSFRTRVFLAEYRENATSLQGPIFALRRWGCIIDDRSCFHSPDIGPNIKLVCPTIDRSRNVHFIIAHHIVFAVGCVGVHCSLWQTYESVHVTNLLCTHPYSDPDSRRANYRKSRIFHCIFGQPGYAKIKRTK